MANDPPPLATATKDSLQKTKAFDPHHTSPLVSFPTINHADTAPFLSHLASHRHTVNFHLRNTHQTTLSGDIPPLTQPSIICCIKVENHSKFLNNGAALFS
jgi:hypothetical protein